MLASASRRRRAIDVCKKQYDARVLDSTGYFFRQNLPLPEAMRIVASLLISITIIYNINLSFILKLVALCQEI